MLLFHNNSVFASVISVHSLSVCLSVFSIFMLAALVANKRIHLVIRRRRVYMALSISANETECSSFGLLMSAKCLPYLTVTCRGLVLLNRSGS